MNDSSITAAGATHCGHIRRENEDVFLCDDSLGLFGVFDGMGGYRAGDVAAELACDVVVAHLRRHPGGGGREMADALSAASQRIFERATDEIERHGMGTTAALVWLRDDRAWVAHVGDSRVYLLRDGKMRQLTSDHTVVAAMIEAGAMTPEEAKHHPYQNVLSRCLGHTATVEVEPFEVALEAGDRIVICSDGLSGFASHAGIEKVVGGAESPEAAVHDLVELALRGGGGDNVSAVVLFAGAVVVPQETAALRNSCSREWQERRGIFVNAAERLGIADSPVCAHVPRGEAVDIVAGNLFDAIYVDLKSNTGIHVWTFGDNLAHGWFGTGGGLKELSALMDTLRASSQYVIADLADSSASLACVLEEQVLRAFMVIESAFAGGLATSIRRLDATLMESHQRLPIVTDGQDQPTLPYLGGRQTEAPSDAVRRGLGMAIQAVSANLTPAASQCARVTHELAEQAFGGAEVLSEASSLLAADPHGVIPLFNAMDEARVEHLRAAKMLDIELTTRSDAVRRLALAYQSLAQAIALLVVDAGRPVTDRLQEVSQVSTQLRAQVRDYEQRVLELTSKLAGRKGGR